MSVTVVALGLLGMLTACSIPRHSNACETLDRPAIEAKIQQLATDGRIRPDQAQARRDGLDRDVKSYQQGEMTCATLRDQIKYYTQP